MTQRLESTIPRYKIKLVNELVNLIKTKKTILIASIKNLPAAQFQQIGKKLRADALIKVPKKSLIYRAIDESKNIELSKLKDVLDESYAILFSDIDAYELAGKLLKNKTPARAKSGQEAPTDIEIPAGPTDLIPGPAISELGALGIKIQIKDGKIEISEPKIVAKQGEAISAGACDVMGKLDIKPFSVGYIPLSAFDLEKGILYNEINIDTEGTTEALKDAFSRALPFAVEIGYANDETIRFMIQKAVAYEMAIGKLSPAEEEKTEVKEEASKEEESNSQEEVKGEVTEEKSEEAPAKTTDGDNN